MVIISSQNNSYTFEESSDLFRLLQRSVLECNSDMELSNVQKIRTLEILQNLIEQKIIEGKNEIWQNRKKKVFFNGETIELNLSNQAHKDVWFLVKLFDLIRENKQNEILLRFE